MWKMTETSHKLVGERVKVLSYGGATEANHYIGLEGLVLSSRGTSRGEVFIVLLDKDPNPQMEAWLGGLPCYENELEVLPHA